MTASTRATVLRRSRAATESFYEGVGALVERLGDLRVLILGQLEGGNEWSYGGKPYWVLSSRDLPVPGGEGVDVRIVDGAVPDLHDEMLASAGAGHLWVVGGGNVASQFADAGPLGGGPGDPGARVLGTGKPLFDRRPPATRCTSQPCFRAATAWSSWITRFAASRYPAACRPGASRSTNASRS